MKYPVVKFMFGSFVALIAAGQVFAQPSFIVQQKSYGKVGVVFQRQEDSLKNEFAKKKLSWPPKSIYIRSFKYDQLMEIWVKGNEKEPYRFFKSYAVCMQSGKLGPKRIEGDYQVPEGFYYINELNPNSNYHLSLGLNYPNASDRILSDSLRPGGEIYIHGNCVSVGCIAINDQPIEELYVLTTWARTNGQDFIPVHVFPVKYDEKNSMNYLSGIAKDNAALRNFEASLKEAFDYFKEKKQLPAILINKKGEYIID